jgi:hypothetical protein
MALYYLDSFHAQFISTMAYDVCRDVQKIDKHFLRE